MIIFMNARDLLYAADYYAAGYQWLFGHNMTTVSDSAIVNVIIFMLAKIKDCNFLSAIIMSLQLMPCQQLMIQCHCGPTQAL